MQAKKGYYAIPVVNIAIIFQITTKIKELGLSTKEHNYALLLVITQGTVNSSLR